MVGRRSPREHAPGVATDDPIVCPLCERPIPRSARQSRHHLTPRLKGGRETVQLHQICHSAIHARYSEAEIARRLAEIEALRRDPEIARFLAWIRTKPADFHAPTHRAKSHRVPRRGKR